MRLVPALILTAPALVTAAVPALIIFSTGGGSGDLAAAARVFRTYKVPGRERVAVLDGALVADAQARNPSESGVHRPHPPDGV
jgi:3-mercaptopyruvate sulfurtransferase SseA